MLLCDVEVHTHCDSNQFTSLVARTNNINTTHTLNTYNRSIQHIHCHINVTHQCQPCLTNADCDTCQHNNNNNTYYDVTQTTTQYCTHPNAHAILAPTWLSHKHGRPTYNTSTTWCSNQHINQHWQPLSPLSNISRQNTTCDLISPTRHCYYSCVCDELGLCTDCSW